MKLNKKLLSSLKVRLFFTISLTIILIILFLIIVNNFALENFYLYTKQQTLKSAYEKINESYQNSNYETDIEEEIEKISIKNNFDIMVKDSTGINVYTTNKNFPSATENINGLFDNRFSENKQKPFEKNEDKEIENNSKYTIKKQKDFKNGLSYLMLSGNIENGYSVYIRIPLSFIEDSVKISNNFLLLMASFTLLIAFILVLIVSRKFSDPILELNDIAKKMSNLDFSHKYKVTDSEDELNTLGKSINVMSDKLERTIKQLRDNNIELEKDIEEKSKLDEMRTSFISDVSHELKTPIALIQGYSEGLLENVNSDEASRKFYAEVILDETNKMDRLVKQLLELMKLEYGKREFDNHNFNIIELEKEVVRKSKVMLDEKNIKVEFDKKQKMEVFADDFYIEQVLTNYITNAIKHAKEVDGKKIIKISNEKNKNTKKTRVKVFNSGDQIKEEDLNRVWNRFYKADESRNRDDGGTGIGLSLVKAIMNNYESDYGVNNVEGGVEFYFEI